jgi:hypothetical protein
MCKYSNAIEPLKRTKKSISISWLLSYPVIYWLSINNFYSYFSSTTEIRFTYHHLISTD